MKMLWEEIAQNSIIGKVCLQYSLSDITHLLQSQNIQRVEIQMIFAIILLTCKPNLASILHEKALKGLVTLLNFNKEVECLREIEE